MYSEYYEVTDAVNKAFDIVFDAVSKLDDIEDVVVEYKEKTTGVTIRKSWRDREDNLTE